MFIEWNKNCENLNPVLGLLHYTAWLHNQPNYLHTLNQ